METSYLNGLSSEKVAEKLKKEGYNELPKSGSRGLLKIILDTFKEPMLILLLLCAIIYFPLGKVEDAIILLSMAIIIILITIYQEHKTENTLNALRDLAAPLAIVVR